MRWWRAYVERVAPPVLDAYLSHGVVLEPHLQNVLVGVDDAGIPVEAVFRDLEGTKLVAGRHDLSDLPGRVADRLAYDAASGWNRVLYCLMVNHLPEVAATLAGTSPEADALLRELWAAAGRCSRATPPPGDGRVSCRTFWPGRRCPPRPTCRCDGRGRRTARRGMSRWPIPWRCCHDVPGGSPRAPFRPLSAVPGDLPAYVYDLAALDAHAAAVRAALDGVELYYAVKANPDAELLRVLAPHVDGFEVASGGAGARARAVPGHARRAGRAGQDRRRAAGGRHPAARGEPLRTAAAAGPGAVPEAPGRRSAPGQPGRPGRGRLTGHGRRGHPVRHGPGRGRGVP
nr:hypothetical protein GCM10020093_059500 [Planobispora longispora]